jgi:hypothetical protein
MLSDLPGIAIELLALSALAYLGVCGLLYCVQRQLIYYPQATRAAIGDTDFELVRDGVTLRGWIVNPGRFGAILYFGGNAERIELNRVRFAHWFPNRTTYLLAYRGFGASDGTPRERALYADALALYDQVRARRPDAPIALIGRSLGGGVASYLASQRPVERLVLITPFDSLAETAQTHYPWLPARYLIKDRYDSVRHLANYRGPVLIVQAGQDEVIPTEDTARLVNSLAHCQPTIINVPEARHNTIDEYAVFERALAAFVGGP